VWLVVEALKLCPQRQVDLHVNMESLREGRDLASSKLDGIRAIDSESRVLSHQETYHPIEVLRPGSREPDTVNRERVSVPGGRDPESPVCLSTSREVFKDWPRPLEG
jgi:hypothetical protein